MAQDVLCEVNNCKFWATVINVWAEAIYVVSHKGKRIYNGRKTDCKNMIRRCKFFKGSKSWCPFINDSIDNKYSFFIH